MYAGSFSDRNHFRSSRLPPIAQEAVYKAVINAAQLGRLSCPVVTLVELHSSYSFLTNPLHGRGDAARNNRFPISAAQCGGRESLLRVTLPKIKRTVVLPAAPDRPARDAHLDYRRTYQRQTCRSRLVNSCSHGNAVPPAPSSPLRRTEPAGTHCSAERRKFLKLDVPI